MPRRRCNKNAKSTTDRPAVEAARTFDCAAWARGVLAEAGELTDEDRMVLEGQMESFGRVDSPLAPLPPDPTAVTIVRDRSALKQLAARLEGVPEIVIDLETSTLDPATGEIVGIGLSIADANYYLPTGHRFADSKLLRPDQLSVQVVARQLQLNRRCLIAQNAKFEFRWLRRHAGISCHFFWDVMLAARLLAPHLPADLKALAARELDVPDWSLRGEEIPAVQFLPVERVGRYCGKDCFYTLKLYLKQTGMPELNRFLTEEVEVKLIPVVADLEDNGYKIDCAHFEQLRERLEPEKEKVLKRIRKTAGKNFNPGSPTQLRSLLYQDLKIRTTRRTKTRLPSTDNRVLQRAGRKHKVALDIIRYRELNKILGTYTKIPEQVGDDSRLHVSFNQLAAETGRFSSPSIIQTLPKDDQFQIRHGFVAGPGNLIVGADFDQQELRVLAQCSDDRKMQAAIKAGVDLHGRAAVMVFKLPCEPGEVKDQFPQERGRVKAVQFGLLYGKTAYSLADDLQIELKAAEQLIVEYFHQFPKVKRFIAGAHNRLLRDGYVEDIFGRRRYFPEVQQKLPRRKERRHMSEQERTQARAVAKAKREAQNFLIQGASATITKLAMIRCHQHIATEHPDIKMLLTLHDELQFEVPEPLVPHFAQKLPDLMCNLDLEQFGFTVPMKVEVKVGRSWGELKKWEGVMDGASRTRKAAK